MQPSSHARNSGRLLLLAGVVGLVAGLMLLASGPGARFGLWSFRFGFQLMTWGAYAGIAAMGLGIFGLLWRMATVRQSPSIVVLTGIVIGAIAFGIPYAQRKQAQSVPPIHDISTDTSDPPQFVAVLPLRADAPNTAEYGGPEIAAQQAQAYPDIQPIILSVPTAQVFDAAVKAARSMNLDIVAEDPDAGRLEATDTTFWYGFKDDLVVRIRAEGSTSRVDVRSVSRVGRSDIGTNAARIRAFRTALEQNL